ncbi:autotransporter outer membrane beta-barrel domain-containing protein, partial [Escherichia coli]|nr:autotransporter outer membrane beta-barrel domain-containing protein [Escherichia coli]
GETYPKSDLFNKAGVGLNARFGDNTRLGLEVERSAFGKYNTDDAINANIRYSF